MLIRQIALLTKTKKVLPRDLMRVSAALQRQVTRDFADVWNIQATVDPFGDESEVPPGYWKITVMDKIQMKGAAGFHLDNQRQPYAQVQWSPDWSITASHECLEMLVDPFGHQTVSGPSPKQGQGRVNFLVEVCDPCETFSYTINTSLAGMEVKVSDFYTPDYFSPNQTDGVRYSFLGNLSAPRQVRNGGYLSWQTPADGHIWQLYGPAEMEHFVDQGEGELSRENTDAFARTTRSKPPAKPVRKRPVGRGAPTADGAQCNLTRDPLTGNLNGASGAQTTVQIQDPSGAATFRSISYDGTQLGKNTSSVSFPLKKGGKALTFVYTAPVPGDLVQLVDPCGTVLDAFPNDLGNPIGFETVVAS
jgi:hypothetical protein